MVSLSVTSHPCTAFCTRWPNTILGGRIFARSGSCEPATINVKRKTTWHPINSTGHARASGEWRRRSLVTRRVTATQGNDLEIRILWSSCLEARVILRETSRPKSAIGVLVGSIPERLYLTHTELDRAVTCWMQMLKLQLYFIYYSMCLQLWLVWYCCHQPWWNDWDANVISAYHKWW